MQPQLVFTLLAMVLCKSATVSLTMVLLVLNAMIIDTPILQFSIIYATLITAKFKIS
jgi:hypothetical protein